MFMVLCRRMYRICTPPCGVVVFFSRDFAIEQKELFELNMHQIVEDLVVHYAQFQWSGSPL